MTKEDTIEGIIRDYCEGAYPVSEDGSDANGKTYKDFAKAIEQYVIKARDRMEEIYNHHKDHEIHEGCCVTCYMNAKDIGELKKGLIENP